MGIKGLLWIEWRRYRWYFWYFMLAFIAMSPKSILLPVSRWIYQADDNAAAWSTGIKDILAAGSSDAETAAMVLVVLFAALILAGERGGSLNYLVTTSVRRREIIIAKFISGWLAIVTIMFIISLFLVAAQALQPALYAMQEVLEWAVITTVALLCMFSLALLVASFCQGILSSVFTTALLIGLPYMLTSSISQVYSKFYTLSAGIELWLHYLKTYLFIPDYISRDDRYIQVSNSHVIIDRVNPDYSLEITLLLLAAGFFLWLAIKVFEINPLERRGEILLFGNFKQIAMIFISLLTAVLWAGDLASSPASYLLYFPILWLGLYLAMYVGVWVIGWLARYGWGRD